MAKKDRTGNRITREQRAVRRIPEMGFYLVVTDTEATERCYFTGLHKSLPSGIRHKLVIKVVALVAWCVYFLPVGILSFHHFHFRKR